MHRKLDEYCKKIIRNEIFLTFRWYLERYVKIYESARKFLKWWCLHYDDGVVAHVLTFQKVSSIVSLFMRLQTELDKQRTNANIAYLKIQKVLVQGEKKKKHQKNHEDLRESLRQNRIEYKIDEDLDILYNASIVFALGYLSVPLIQITFFLFFPLWILIFIFVFPPIVIAVSIITLTLSIIDDGVWHEEDQSLMTGEYN
jgi:hypothetical protein